MATATYDVLVDWNNDGAFSGSGEDVTARVRSELGLTIQRGRDQIRQLAPPMAGTIDFDLDNQSRDYSPENASSPLTGNLVPGHEVRVRATYGGTTYSLARGFLDDLPQQPARQSKSASVPCLGILSRLRGKTISTALYQNIRTDEALAVILNTIGLYATGSSQWGTALWGTALWAMAAPRVLDVGQTTLEWWWLNEEDAFSAAVALLNAEGPGAALYEDADGRIVFESRHYRLKTTRSNISQVTFRDTGTEPTFTEPFRYKPNIKGVINVAEIEVKKRTAQALAKVWELGSTLTLGANEVRKVKVKTGDPFTGAVTPAAGTDYTVTAGSVSVSLNRTSGAVATIMLTAGSSGATITGLQLRAQSVTVTSTTLIENTIDTAASIRKYGRQTYAGPISAEISVNVAQDLANAIVSLYKEPRATVEIALVNASDAQLTQQLTREISDRITVIEPQTGLNGDVWIEQIRHEVTQAGKVHRTALGCEKVNASNYGLWGSALWGTNVWGF